MDARGHRVIRFLPFHDTVQWADIQSHTSYALRGSTKSIMISHFKSWFLKTSRECSKGTNASNSTARRVFYHRETNSHEQTISAERVPTMSRLNFVSPLRELHLIIHMSVNKVNSCHGSSCPKWPFTGRIVSKHMAELPVCVKTHAHSVGTYRIRLGNIR